MDGTTVLGKIDYIASNYMNRGKHLSWFANFSATCRRLIKLLARFEPISQSSVYSMRVQVLTAMTSGRFIVMTMSVLLAGEDDLPIVKSAVTNLAGRWKDLGISLGVRACDLEAKANASSPRNCLREMLLQWLRQSYNVCTT